MATFPIHASFGDLDRIAFRAYAQSLLALPDADQRNRVVAYMHQTLAQDGVALDTDQATINTRRRRRREHRQILEEEVVAQAHDFSKSSSLFTEQPKTDPEILALLTQDGVDVHIRDRSFTGTVVLSGDNVTFRGLGVTGTAVGGDLAHTCIITGKIEISGSDVTLEGLHFKFDAQWVQNSAEFPMISFSGGTNTKVTLKNCTFENTGSNADGRFWHGPGSGGGVQAIDGCVIKNFTSWMLLDATTASGTPTVRLESFSINACKFDNCMGSMAVRGLQANPNGLASFTDNLFAFGAAGQHASFWDIVEANNTLRVICTGNTVTGAVHGANRGFLQAWSRSSVPWVVRYKNNTIANFGAAFRCACNATFYCPNTYDDEALLKSQPAETTNVTYGASYVYPYQDATQTYAPENSATFPTEPSAADFAGLSNFAHA